MPASRPIRWPRRRPGCSPGPARAITHTCPATDLSQVDAWYGTGGALSIIANRVSYFFDLRGPSVTVRYGVFVVAGGGSPGLSEPAGRRFEPGAGRRGEPAALTGGDPELRPGRGDVDDRAVPCL